MSINHEDYSNALGSIRLLPTILNNAKFLETERYKADLNAQTSKEVANIRSNTDLMLQTMRSELEKELQDKGYTYNSLLEVLKKNNTKEIETLKNELMTKLENLRFDNSLTSKRQDYINRLKEKRIDAVTAKVLADSQIIMDNFKSSKNDGFLTSLVKSGIMAKIVGASEELTFAKLWDVLSSKGIGNISYDDVRYINEGVTNEQGSQSETKTDEGESSHSQKRTTSKKSEWNKRKSGASARF